MPSKYDSGQVILLEGPDLWLPISIVSPLTIRLLPPLRLAKVVQDGYLRASLGSDVSKAWILGGLFMPTLLGRGSFVPWFPALENHLEPFHQAQVTATVEPGNIPRIPA